MRTFADGGCGCSFKMDGDLEGMPVTPIEEPETPESPDAPVM